MLLTYQRNVSQKRDPVIKSDGNYHINKVIRDMCIFAVHNFVKDPAFARIDLITCRNTLIYFDPYLQNKVLSTFHYSLKEKGMLFLGKSESVTHSQDLFESVKKHEKIYVRKFVPGKYTTYAFKPATGNLQVKSNTSEIKAFPEEDFKKIASDILLTKYTPASVIINKNLDIVHFHGDTSPFLSPSPGKPNFNILKMAREGIGFELQNAILKIKEEKENIRKDHIKVNTQPYQVSFEISLLPKQVMKNC